MTPCETPHRLIRRFNIRAISHGCYLGGGSTLLAILRLTTLYMCKNPLIVRKRRPRRGTRLSDDVRCEYAVGGDKLLYM